MASSSDFIPDTDYVRLAYIDRRDFVSQISRVERLSDEDLEYEFDTWLKRVMAKAYSEGHEACYDYYSRGNIKPQVNPYEES